MMHRKVTEQERIDMAMGTRTPPPQSPAPRLCQVQVHGESCGVSLFPIDKIGSSWIWQCCIHGVQPN